MKKTPTIFLRNLENMKEVSSERNPLCEWVFLGEGAATRKYDGTCCLVENGKLFKRREIKKGKQAPENFINVDYDKATGKTIGWVPVNFEAKEDLWHKEAFVGDFVDGTYELLGPKVQSNPEKCDAHMLIKHSEAEEYDDVPRQFQALRAWMKDRDIEGIVFHHPDGRMAKIKKRDFGLER